MIQRLQPRAVFPRAIEGAGDWAVRYGAFGQPAFTVILAGQARLAVDGQPPLDLQPGDFVLLPATPGFTLSGGAPTPPVWLEPQAGAIVTDEKSLRHGRLGGDPDFVSLGGWFEFATPTPPCWCPCCLPSARERRRLPVAWCTCCAKKPPTRGQAEN